MYSTEFKIVTTVEFDRESRDHFVVSITCKDHGLPAQTSVVALRIVVTDINDHAPTFTTTDNDHPIEVYIILVYYK